MQFSTWFVALCVSLIVLAIAVAYSFSARSRALTRRIHDLFRRHRLTDTAEAGDGDHAVALRELDAVGKRLEELDDLKKDFVAHVSHDLKGPLVSARETIRVLSQQIAGPLNENQLRLLALSSRNWDRLSAMLDHLLDAAQIQAEMMEYTMKSHDVVVLVRGAAEAFRSFAQERKIELAVEIPDGPLWMECDGPRITQVFSNLLGNAAKFSAAGGRVLLRLEPQASGFLLSVWDNGSGVADVDKVRIFDLFHQDTRRKYSGGQGIGVGLMISRAIVLAHHGNIWVENNPAGGSVFYVSIKPG